MSSLDSHTCFFQCFPVSSSSIAFFIILTVFRPWVLSPFRGSLFCCCLWPRVLLNFLKAAFLKSGVAASPSSFRSPMLCYLKFFLVGWSEARRGGPGPCLAAFVVIGCSAGQDEPSASRAAGLPRRHLGS